MLKYFYDIIENPVMQYINIVIKLVYLPCGLIHKKRKKKKKKRFGE